MFKPALRSVRPKPQQAVNAGSRTETGSPPGLRLLLTITSNIEIADSDIEFNAIRAQGPGGQKVNKSSSAIHLRFDINASSLPDHYKQQLLRFSDQRISADGIIVIKARQYRTREQNREDALQRLRELILAATKTQKARRSTRPTHASRKRRMDSKTRHGQLKQSRRKVDFD